MMPRVGLHKFAEMIFGITQKPLYIGISRKGVPAPPFLRHPPLDPACPLFKISVSPPIFYVPPSFKVFSTVSSTLTQPPPAVIRPTNLSWFKQISKEQFLPVQQSLSIKNQFSIY